MNDARPRFHDRIVTDPEILVGKPVVKGTRISVELVLEFLAHTPDLDELFADYPELTREDVQAVLAYAQAAVAGQHPPPTPKPEAPARAAQA